MQEAQQALELLQWVGLREPEGKLSYAICPGANLTRGSQSAPLFSWDDHLLNTTPHVPGPPRFTSSFYSLLKQQPSSPPHPNLGIDPNLNASLPEPNLNKDSS